MEQLKESESHIVIDGVPINIIIRDKRAVKTKERIQNLQIIAVAVIVVALWAVTTYIYYGCPN